MFNPFKQTSPGEKKTEASPASDRPVEEAPQPASGNSPEFPEAPENQPIPPQGGPAAEPLNPAGVESPTTPPGAAPLRRPRGFLYHLLGYDTRAGRVMRPVLRWLAAISGLFALGLLAGYLLLYRPAQAELEAANQKLAEMNQSITQKDQSQVTAQMDRDQAVKSLQQAQADLKKASSENDLLVVLSGVNSARVALVNKDGQSAKTLIEQAQADLARAAGYIETQDKNRSDLLKSRLDLAAREMVSDPQAALADLDKLAADLSDLRAKLFKK